MFYFFIWEILNNLNDLKKKIYIYTYISNVISNIEEGLSYEMGISKKNIENREDIVVKRENDGGGISKMGGSALILWGKKGTLLSQATGIMLFLLGVCFAFYFTHID